MTAKIIEKNGRPEFAVIPYEDYRHLLELLEDEADARVVAEFHEAYSAGREFLVPHEIVRRELAGESPIKLWRELRGLTQQDLATRAGISKPYLSQIKQANARERLKRYPPLPVHSMSRLSS